MSTVDLRAQLEQAWCAETSVDPKTWTADLPSRGQCAVTALVVQDLLGGTLIRSEVDGVSHYAVGTDEGAVIDLTGDQFGPDVVWPAVRWESRTRDYVLSWPDTARRYQLLVQKLYGR